jgi:hypothetical protein
MIKYVNFERKPVVAGFYPVSDERSHVRKYFFILIKTFSQI